MWLDSVVTISINFQKPLRALDELCSTKCRVLTVKIAAMDKMLHLSLSNVLLPTFWIVLGFFPCLLSEFSVSNYKHFPSFKAPLEIMVMPTVCVL